MNYQQNVKHILATCIISVLQALAWLLDRLTQEKQFFREVRKCCKENCSQQILRELSSTMFTLFSQK